MVFHTPMHEELSVWLEGLLGEAGQVRSFEPLAGGACQDNHRVEFVPAARPDEKIRLALRSDATSKLPGSLDRAAEASVISAARAAGVETPRVRGLAKDLLREGAVSCALDWVEGTAIGRQIVGSPGLAAAREKLPGELAVQLARIHSIRRDAHPSLLPARLGWSDRGEHVDPVLNTLGALRKTLDEMPEAHPALEWAFAWLVAHTPPPKEVVLVHGDFRTGNFMVTPEGLRGILDWEFAHWGYPEEDLAWICLRDWRFGVLDKPVGGFAERRPFYEAYEAASGRAVDLQAAHFWEIWGNVHWAAGCIYQGERYRSGESSDLELIAVARRAAEMEYEALRLIEKGAR